MGSTEERTCISKLTDLECRTLLKSLEVDITNVKGIVNLKILLQKVIPEKVEIEEFKEIIKVWGVQKTLEHQRLTLRRWALDLQEENLIEFLTKDNLQTGGSLHDLRKRFSRYLISTTGEPLQSYLELAQTHLESLLHESLMNEDDDLGKSDEEQEANRTAKPLNLNAVRSETATAPTFLRPPSTANNNESANGEEHNFPIRQPPQTGRAGNTSPRQSPRIPHRNVNFDTNAEHNQFRPEFHIHQENSSSMTSQNSNNKGELMDRVRKWGLKFTGTGKPQEATVFLERLEDQADCYGIPLDLVPDLIIEFLREKAASWYRNNKGQWANWYDFKRSFEMFFIPKKTKSQLENDVHRHHQGNNNIRDYIIDMQVLMSYLPEYVFRYL